MFLFEPEKYPGNRQLCTKIFPFEPNPKHAIKQLNIQQAYLNQGLKYVFLPFAICDRDGVVQFFRNHRKPPGTTEQEVGFSEAPKEGSDEKFRQLTFRQLTSMRGYCAISFLTPLTSRMLC